MAWHGFLFVKDALSHDRATGRAVAAAGRPGRRIRTSRVAGQLPSGEIATCPLSPCRCLSGDVIPPFTAHYPLVPSGRPSPRSRRQVPRRRRRAPRRRSPHGTPDQPTNCWIRGPLRSRERSLQRSASESRRLLRCRRMRALTLARQHWVRDSESGCTISIRTPSSRILRRSSSRSMKGHRMWCARTFLGAWWTSHAWPPWRRLAEPSSSRTPRSTPEEPCAAYGAGHWHRSRC